MTARWSDRGCGYWLLRFDRWEGWPLAAEWNDGMHAEDANIEYRTSPSVGDADLNRLFAAAWDGHRQREFKPVLSRSLAYICAFDHERLIGFVNVAWDGGGHAFLLDTTVLPDYQRRGVATELVRRAAMVAGRAGIEWLHVDYEPHLDGFYSRCGFRPTQAGLLRLSPAPAYPTDAVDRAGR